MKKNYYLFMLLTLLTVNFINAQLVCPEYLGPQSSTTVITFKITAGSCSSYSDILYVTSGAFNATFNKTSCTGTNLKYITTGGSLPDADTFVANFQAPNAGICQYVNGSLVTLSNGEASFSDKVVVYPNPLLNGDQLIIKFKSNLSARFEMFNVAGKMVLSDTAINEDSKTLNTGNLSNGIYMLKISNDNTSTTRKIVIMK